jgi:tripartite-type tricarboxylate transporter receptor subunit TctC
MTHSTPFTRRSVLAAGLASAAAGLARAADFPTRPITFISPFPAGATADAQIRALALAAGKVLGQTIVVDIAAGAAGTLGPAKLLHVRPDGYTLSQGNNNLYRQPFISKTTYDPAVDFTYIIGISGFNFGLAVRSDSGWRTLQEFLAYAKANPGKVSFGTIGVGSQPYNAMAMLAEKNGITWTDVLFKGTAESVNALRGGHVTAISEGTGWAPMVRSGDFRLLAVYGPKRLKQFPDVPTLRELGYDFSGTSPWGVLGPKGMDPQVVKTLHDAFRAAMEDPAFLQTLDTVVTEPAYMSTEEYQAFSKRQIGIEKAIVEKYGLANK